MSKCGKYIGCTSGAIFLWLTYVLHRLWSVTEERHDNICAVLSFRSSIGYNLLIELNVEIDQFF